MTVGLGGAFTEGTEVGRTPLAQRESLLGRIKSEPARSYAAAALGNGNQAPTPRERLVTEQKVLSEARRGCTAVVGHWLKDAIPG